MARQTDITEVKNRINAAYAKHFELFRVPNEMGIPKGTLVKKLKEKEKSVKRYGLTIEQFEKIYLEQKENCAICYKPFIAFWEAAVDHCHKTGKVRGLLHPNCNAMLGMADEDPMILQGGITYLEKHENQQSS